MKVKDKKPAVVQHLKVSSSLRSLLHACWHEEPTRRPTADKCWETIKDELEDPGVDSRQQAIDTNMLHNDLEGELPSSASHLHHNPSSFLPRKRQRWRWLHTAISSRFTDSSMAGTNHVRPEQSTTRAHSGIPRKWEATRGSTPRINGPSCQVLSAFPFTMNIR